MPYRDLAEPVRLPMAFGEDGDEAAQSQAAMLLLVGSLMRDEPVPPGTARAAAPVPPRSLIPEEDRADLNIPESIFELDEHRGSRYGSGLIMERFGTGTADLIREARAAEPRAVSALSEVQVSLAERLYREPDPETAAELVEASVEDPDPLVRVAAASSYFDVFADLDGQRHALEVLVVETDSREAIVREVARTALARVSPSHPTLDGLQPPSGASEEAGGESPRTALLVHGTFARGNTWWQPGGDFHSYLRQDVRPGVYSADDRFDWSGGYSDRARTLGAARLRTWVADRGLEGLDLFCHSHGGSVAMEASQEGLAIGQLVLLSCPVHRGKYDPNFEATDDVVSIRTRLDLVILADGGGQRFRDPRVREHRLPIWFKHSATHRPRVWMAHDLPDVL